MSAKEFADMEPLIPSQDQNRDRESLMDDHDAGGGLLIGFMQIGAKFAAAPRCIMVKFRTVVRRTSASEHTAPVFGSQTCVGRCGCGARKNRKQGLLF